MSKPEAPRPDFEAQARLVTQLAERVTDAQLAAPTPCPQYAVRNLLGHLAGLSVAFRDAARKDFGPTTDTDPGSVLPDIEEGWRGAMPKNLAELAGAWGDPAAWEGETRVGGVDLPAFVCGQVGLNELVVHGWDLARATDQLYAPDEASLTVVHDFMASWGDDREGTLFGPPIRIPQDAPLLDRVVALSGRRPDWRPE